jgi:hypothetical protein
MKSKKRKLFLKISVFLARSLAKVVDFYYICKQKEKEWIYGR